MDFRPGGAWRYLQTDASGNEFNFNGVYTEIVPREKLVYIFNFEAIPGHELVETVTFEDLGDKTKVTTRDVYPSIEDLQGMLQSGMEEDLTESNERLSELLEKQKVSH
jgi:uncharacterized protein YndB with AHSA1/START domain